VLPDRSYSYGVRAVNTVGVSPFTSPVTVTTPPSLDLALVKGLVVDSPIFLRDQLKVTALVTANGLSPDGAYDPVADGITLRLGAEDQSPLINLGAADPGWLPRKKGRFLWRSPREAVTKVKILYDPATGTLKVGIRKLNFETPQVNPVLLWVGVSNDAGHFESDWFERKPGLLKYPVPE